MHTHTHIYVCVCVCVCVYKVYFGFFVLFHVYIHGLFNMKANFCRRTLAAEVKTFVCFPRLLTRKRI